MRCQRGKKINNSATITFHAELYSDSGGQAAVTKAGLLALRICRIFSSLLSSLPPNNHQP